LNAKIDNVHSSSSIATYYLKNNYPNTKCYVIGMSGICENIKIEG
jgi:ribonucleotide monophosphatase NagD (HAD superfamily)